MKKQLSVFAMALLAVVAASAQSYKLTEMSAETFAKGGDGQWSFEKYTYETGVYSLLTMYTDSCACNYLDIYQPERVAGQLITEIEGVEAAGENTWASNVRWGWCDLTFSTDVRNNSVERFIYVVQDPREGFGYEVMGNDYYTSVITFTVPEDGYYRVNGTVIREDGDAWTETLDIVPRYRYAQSADQNVLSSASSMGLAFNYGANRGLLPEYDGTSGSLANGAAQKFVAQEPVDFEMAFAAKAGDKISFEVNTAKMKGVGGDWGHGWWSRTFFRALNVEKVDEAAASAATNYVDPYDMSGVEELMNLADSYWEQTFDMTIGTSMGDYGEKEYNNFMALYDELAAAFENGLILSMNYHSYLAMLEEAWRVLQLSEVVIDYACEGNYVLIATDNTTGITTVDDFAMADNTGNPWEFCWYDVAAGVYNLFANHDYSSKFGSDTIPAWYKGTGDWLYISDNGNIHPTTAHSPAYVFVAPADGVYKFEFACYRPNPNANVENPLWIRSRFLQAGKTSVTKEEFIFAKEYGSVANDGEGGKAPIDLNFFANLQAGDRITFEEDCYTTNRNSSAGTQVTRLVVCSRANEDSLFTIGAIKAIGADLYDPYGTGDPSGLIEAVAYADSVMNVYKDSVGVDGGQYSVAVYTTLGDYVAEAKALIAAASSTQPVYDKWAIDVKSLADQLIASRIPFEVVISGKYKIRLDGTVKYITQKNSAGDHFYAAVADSATIIADAEKNSVDLSVYKQEFTLAQPYGTSATVITSEDGYMTLDGYVLPGEDTTAVHTFTIYKYDLADEACCIMRSDGLYWAGAYAWKSPYDKMNTSATPAYIFCFESTEDTAIEDVAATSVVVATEYYTLSGVRTMMPQGITIRKRTLDDGRVLIDKMYLR